MPTETPPPYFPQDMLSPGDPKTARKMRVVFYGCAALSLVGVVAVILAIAYLIRTLL